MAPGLNGTGHEPRHKSSKKRHLDPSHAEKSERKHKRSKSHTVPASTLPAEPAETESSPKKKHKAHKASKPKHSHIKEEEQQQHEADEQGDHDGEKRSRKKKSSKEDKEDKEKKKSKQSRLDDEDNKHHDHDEDVIAPAQEHFGVVVLESSRSKAILGAGKSIEHQFPFYTQTVSQYLPLHPLGISEPVQGYMNQHLEPLLNHYVPGFGGVLLSYRNPRIGAAPGDGSLTQDSGMEDVAILESINEHAVSFGWLTVEIDIFRPSRGAWLEGLVNIQSGGHIGVVCWGKFNASIESERLPRDWRWVDQHARKDKEQAEPEAKDDATGDHTEVHATGYWVNKDGARITADTPIRFRIKNYEVGSSGDYGYLSMEGTMLTEEEEAKKSQKEREIQKRKLSRGVAPRRERRTMLELGMTKFTNDDGREPDSQPQPPETS
ncbi:hypothetical protein F5B22DRAFT_639324 [Xylaria bambusicola]|uniref:uncharacterized protein n=1 Tax=Xylaria bambusicola TaxID=326684 RepID=UPI0020074CF2|nr:uncharacterized protein F5B22DRAFT_639324 [Xylaria bambusicola]KAI0506320.1 hypothetical protein F5B22DRAFT_639324 [Xylaria bambusicola]